MFYHLFELFTEAVRLQRRSPELTGIIIGGVPYTVRMNAEGDEYIVRSEDGGQEYRRRAANKHGLVPVDMPCTPSTLCDRKGFCEVHSLTAYWKANGPKQGWNIGLFDREATIKLCRDKIETDLMPMMAAENTNSDLIEIIEHFGSVLSANPLNLATVMVVLAAIAILDSRGALPKGSRGLTYGKEGKPN